MDEDLRGDGRAEGLERFALDQRQRQVRDRGVDLVELGVGLLVVGHVAAVIDQELLGSVVDGRIELVGPGPHLAIKEDAERAGQAVLGHPAIEPDGDGLDVPQVFLPVDLLRLPELDIDAAHVRPPAGPGRVLAEILIGVSDPPEVLGLELVLRGRRVRVPGLPEGFDEDVPLFIVFELEEDVLLPGGDDVDHLLFEPLAVDGRQVLGGPFGLRRERQRHQNRQRSDQRQQECFFHDPIIFNITFPDNRCQEVSVLSHDSSLAPVSPFAPRPPGTSPVGSPAFGGSPSATGVFRVISGAASLSCRPSRSRSGRRGDAHLPAANLCGNGPRGSPGWPGPHG